MRNQAKGLRDEYLGLAEREYQGFGDELISVFPKLMMSKVIEKASKTIKHKAENSNLLNGVNTQVLANQYFEVAE